MSKVLVDLMDEENINTNSAAVVLSSESIFIKNVLFQMISLNLKQ